MNIRRHPVMELLRNFGSIFPASRFQTASLCCLRSRPRHHLPKAEKAGMPVSRHAPQRFVRTAHNAYGSCVGSDAVVYDWKRIPLRPSVQAVVYGILTFYPFAQLSP